jgi:hypothetical protein
MVYTCYCLLQEMGSKAYDSASHTATGLAAGASDLAQSTAEGTQLPKGTPTSGLTSDLVGV